MTDKVSTHGNLHSLEELQLQSHHSITDDISSVIAENNQGLKKLDISASSCTQLNR